MKPIKDDKRANFSKSTVKMLRDRANDICSNPDCRKVTRGADSKDGVHNIGEAAHIVAASIGQKAARSDSSISESEKSQYSNGIWLCKNCHKLIDTDEDYYTIELLKRWKLEAEEFSRNNIGKMLLPEHEVQQQVMDTVIQQITGGPIISGIGSLEKMVAHYDRKMNQLDPRFHIQTDIVEGKVSRNILAKERVEIQMHVSHHQAQSFSEQLASFKENGTPLKISTSDIYFTGSPLFEAIGKEISNQGRLTISPVSNKIKVEVLACNANQTHTLGIVNGKTFNRGSKLIIDGVGLNNFMHIRISYDISCCKLHFSYKFNYSLWVGKELSKIPFFNKIRKALNVLCDDGYFTLEFVKDNHEMELKNSSTKKIEESDQVALKQSLLEMYELVEYIYHCRVISDKFKINTKFKCFDDISSEDYDATKYVSHVIQDENESSGEDIEPFSFEIGADRDKLQFIKENEGKIQEFCFTENVKKINLFGEVYSDIKIKHVYSNTSYQISNLALDSADYSSIKVTLNYNKDSRYHRTIDV